MELPVLVSTPGKAILHGEHAVVYGKAALATSLDLRCFLLLRSSSELVLELPDIRVRKSWDVQELTTIVEDEGSSLEALKRLSGILPGTEHPSAQSLATYAFLYLLFGICKEERWGSLPGFHVTIKSNLPFGAGLGSSAAYSVCLAAGLLCATGAISRPSTSDVKPPHPPPLDPPDIPELLTSQLGGHACPHWSSWGHHDLELINKWGYEAEKLMHGMPSGIDNSISTFGGAIHFKSGIVSPLLRMPRLRILLVNTKVPRSTKKMVEGVRRRHDKFPEVIGPVLDSVEALVERAQKELENIAGGTRSAYSTLEEMFLINQHLLNALGVGHHSLDQVLAIALQHGLAAKLTGGGGGGCAIILLHPDVAGETLIAVKRSFESAGFDWWETQIGTQGVSLHW